MDNEDVRSTFPVKWNNKPSMNAFFWVMVGLWPLFSLRDSGEIETIPILEQIWILYCSIGFGIIMFFEAKYQFGYRKWKFGNGQSSVVNSVILVISSMVLLLCLIISIQTYFFYDHFSF